MYNKEKKITGLMLIDYFSNYLIKEKEIIDHLEYIPDVILGLYSMYYEKAKDIVNKYIDDVRSNDYSMLELITLKDTFLVEYKYNSNYFSDDIDKYIGVKRDNWNYYNNVLLGDVMKLKLGELIVREDSVKRIERKKYIKPKRKYVRTKKN